MAAEPAAPTTAGGPCSGFHSNNACITSGNQAMESIVSSEPNEIAYHDKSAPQPLTHTPPDPVSPVMCNQNPYNSYSYAAGSTAAYMSHGGVTQGNYFRPTAFGSHGLLTLNPRFTGVPLMAGGYHSSQQQQHSSLQLSPPLSADPPFDVNSGGFHVPVLRRPPYTFSALIAMAILSSSEKMLTVPDIYEFVSEKFPFYSKDDKWKNAIRHDLWRNRCFQMASAEDGLHRRGNFWMIDPRSDYILENGHFRSQKGKRKTSTKLKLAGSSGQDSSCMVGVPADPTM